MTTNQNPSNHDIAIEHAANANYYAEHLLDELDKLAFAGPDEIENPSSKSLRATLEALAGYLDELLDEDSTAHLIRNTM